jgi:methylenetetrahydrofolate/methylenetetrahydromethanopterin dehydrogenase (NADP+)
MMKKLLYQFDTDSHPSVFDNVVGYDGGADHISAYGAVNAANVGGLVEGAIFTRSPKDKKNTAIFVGGSNMAQGEAVLAAIRAKFFAKFRVSVMFDCNGSNTTAAAAVAWLAYGRSLQGKRVVVLAGSGPVGQRAAVLLAREGAQVAITGRKLSVVKAACEAINSRFGIDAQAIEAPTQVERGAALKGAQIVLAAGASGIALLQAKDWQENASLELIADANASPPAGIEGVGLSDRGVSSHGKVLFGALGFGALKLALQRACVARLFEQNDLLLDAEEIYGIAKGMVGT